MHGSFVSTVSMCAVAALLSACGGGLFDSAESIAAATKAAAVDLEQAEVRKRERLDNGAGSSGKGATTTNTSSLDPTTTSTTDTASTQPVSTTTTSTSATTASTGTASTSTTDTGTPTPSATPTPGSMAGLPVVGAIVARSGQVIEGLHVTTASGPCIVVPAGVTDVTIRNNEIGPCGVAGDLNTYGVSIGSGASRISIQRNLIHDVSTGVFAYLAKHPIIVDRNHVTNIRGPFYRGQMVQFDGVSSGSAGSRITCNVSDVQGAAYDNVEDHISMHNSPGLPGDRTEIAYNRIRGGKSKSGSGMMIGDGPAGGGHVWAHDNVIVNIGNVGMGIAGGNAVTFENNRIFNDGKTSLSGAGITVRNYTSLSCQGHLVRRNRVFSIDVAWSPGVQNPYWEPGQCGITLEGNVFPDATLTAAIFDEVPAACR